MTGSDIAERRAADGWQLTGSARIDDRRPVRCTLIIRPDGTWAAEIRTFTLAGQVDLYFTASAGGEFCGPAFVAYSRADSAPFTMRTELVGNGPLLVVDPRTVRPEIEAGDPDMVDGEVVG